MIQSPFSRNQAFLSVLVFALCLFTVPALAQETADLALANEYYLNKDYEKALVIYQKLARRDENLPKIHNQYFDALQKGGDPKELDKYINRLVKRYPDDPQFAVDYGKHLRNQGDSLGTEKHFAQYLERNKRSIQNLRYLAIYQVDAKLYANAEMAYQALEKTGFVEDLHYELAAMYMAWGKTDKMIAQYMDALGQDDGKIEYVQNAFQETLPADDFEGVEKILIQYAQRNPERIVFTEMLVWFYLQKKEFYKAFMQARGIDRRKKHEGFKILEIGNMALNNGEYREAVRIFEFLVEKYSDKPVYNWANRLMIKSKEELVKNTFPLDLEKIRSLANDYEGMIRAAGIRQSTGEAVRSLALLHAFYLNGRDTAIVLLGQLTGNRGIAKELVSEAKLDLGDIYLLKGEPWEATLLYSQVEKAEKDKHLGHLAKLKNAKLSYYSGDFELAKSHLDILKLATSRETANDAMALSLLIQDNLNLDTTDRVMKEYAETELYVFQGRLEEALVRYTNMIAKHKGHRILDEVYWEKAKILHKMGRFEEAITALGFILKDYGDDVLADDANYLTGKIYEENLKDTKMAMEFYRDQLTKFPGSVYNVEARKRFRALRGDNVN